MADCGCGRSPTGNCIGWHMLSEEGYQEKKAAYEAKKAEKKYPLVELIDLFFWPHACLHSTLIANLEICTDTGNLLSGTKLRD